MTVRVRFAPSPTGPLHIGGARSALFNWLFARHYGGTFIVRVEDTDLERSSRVSEENILESLKWLGLDWDEGVETGGSFGPYRQTERLDTYKKYAQELLESGRAYHCYCSEDELAREREELSAKGELPRYMGRCRKLTAPEAAAFEAQGRKPVVRFLVPEDQTIIINDLVREEVSFECSGIGDFIIVKSDGVPTYNFAVVVDDFLMEISHVIRAEEHLSNTPRQILIYQALNWKLPEFAHVSLILGKDRSKMSKRHGATAIEQYMKLGYLPEAMVNFLVLLGWSPGGEDEVMTLQEICKQFSLERVVKSPAVFDLDKLNWLNACYIRQCPVQRLTDLALPYLHEAGMVKIPVSPEYRNWLEELVLLLKDYLDNMSQIVDRSRMFFDSSVVPVDPEAKEIMSQIDVPLVLKKMEEKIEAAVLLDQESVKKILKEVGKELGLGGKKVFMPLRVAITGQVHGPDLHKVVPVLGAERTINRLKESFARASSSDS